MTGIRPTSDASSKFNFDNVAKTLPDVTGQKNKGSANGNQQKSGAKKKKKTNKNGQNQFIKRRPHSFANQYKGNRPWRWNDMRTNTGSWKQAWQRGYNPQKRYVGRGQWQERWIPLRRRWQAKTQWQEQQIPLGRSWQVVVPSNRQWQVVAPSNRQWQISGLAEQWQGPWEQPMIQQPMVQQPMMQQPMMQQPMMQQPMMQPMMQQPMVEQPGFILRRRWVGPQLRKRFGGPQWRKQASSWRKKPEKLSLKRRPEGLSLKRRWGGASPRKWESRYLRSKRTFGKGYVKRVRSKVWKTTEVKHNNEAMDTALDFVGL